MYSDRIVCGGKKLSDVGRDIERGGKNGLMVVNNFKTYWPSQEEESCIVKYSNFQYSLFILLNH